MDKFRKALDERTRTMIKEQLSLVKITSVDEDKLTCDCKTVAEDLDIFEVSITPVINQEASEVTIIPTVGSFALMAIVGNDIRNCYLVSCQKADKVILRGGSLGGMVKVNELRDNLNKTTNLLKALVQIINGSPVPEPGSGSPSAFQASLKAAIAAHSLGKWDDIENEKVSHG